MTIDFETLKASLVLYGLNARYAAVLLVVGWYLSGLAQIFASRLLTVTHRIDALVTVFAASFARYAVLVVVGIAVLQLFGIQTASLVAVLGATSLAIGLALQGTLSNLAAGVMRLLFRLFHIGDDVEVAGKAGKVRLLSLFTTELVASDTQGSCRTARSGARRSSTTAPIRERANSRSRFRSGQAPRLRPSAMKS
jgi:small conductance mechanosensitive channel